MELINVFRILWIYSSRDAQFARGHGKATGLFLERRNTSGGGYSTVDLVQHGNSGNTYALKSVSKGALAELQCPTLPSGVELCWVLALTVFRWLGRGYVWQTQMKTAIANEKDVLYMTSSPFIIKLFASWFLTF